MRYYPALKVAEMLGICPETVRGRFRQWCEKHGKRYEDFIRWERRKVRNGKTDHIFVRVLYIPEEAVEWIREVVVIGRLPGNSFSLRERMLKRLDNPTVTMRDISEKYGISIRKVRREFRWWCHLNGKNPWDYWVPGLGYVAPKEFVEYFEQVSMKRG